MPTETVFASAGGRRYHAIADCRVFLNGHGMWRFDPNQWVPGMPQIMLTDGHPVREATALAALGAGKTPCAVCIPGSGAALAVSSAEEDFGHEPVIGFTDGRALNRICARCAAIKRGPGIWWHASVRWPCASAVVLGLTERQVTR